MDREDLKNQLRSVAAESGLPLADLAAALRELADEFTAADAEDS